MKGREHAMNTIKSIVITLALAGAASAFAEEWGFAFSGQLQETRENVKYPLDITCATNLFIRLYDDSEGVINDKKLALWGRQVTVHTKGGLFSCELKDSNGVPLLARFDRLQEAFTALKGTKFTVGVTPFKDTNAEISPRQTLSSVPFAVNAGDALGSIGDVTVSGTLTAGTLEAPVATFEGAVTHTGDASFDHSPTLSRLSLNQSAELSATALSTEGAVSATSVKTDVLRTDNLTATVKSIPFVSATNLTVTGLTTVSNVTAAAADLTAKGTVKAHILRVKDLKLGGSIDFFQWNPQTATDAFTTVPGGGESGEVTKYIGNAKAGSWTVPRQLNGDIFISLDFKLKAKGATLIKIDNKLVAEHKFGVSSGSAWFPFQIFVARGQTIEWSGDGESVNLRYRLFKY